jgi:tRNA (guanine26-N2/guanine27-N2)-dimethyltransferase
MSEVATGDAVHGGTVSSVAPGGESAPAPVPATAAAPSPVPVPSGEGAAAAPASTPTAVRLSGKEHKSSLKGAKGKHHEQGDKRAPSVLLGDVQVHSGVVPEGFKAVREGSASILLSKGKGGDAFYNEVQVKNRDLSVLVLNEYARQLQVESEEQVAAFSEGRAYLKLPRTWQTWGLGAGAGETAGEEEEGEEAEAGGAAAAGAGQGNGAPKRQRKLRSPDTGFTGMRVLEALAASGLRSLRYVKELSEGVGMEKIVCNDLEQYAVDSMLQNAKFNGLDGDRRFVAQQGDAVEVMFAHRYDVESTKKSGYMMHRTHAKALLRESERVFDARRDPFDVVDLDPYGSPAPFLAQAVQAVREGGLLCITATDMSTMCGKNAELCFTKYRAMPFHGTVKYSHEMAIRILLGSIEAHANACGRHIVPILSVHMDFYVRVFVRVYTDKAEILKASLKSGLVIQSRGSSVFYTQAIGETRRGGADADADSDADADGAGGPGPDKQPQPQQRQRQQQHTPQNVPPVLRAAALASPMTCPETGAAMTVGGPIWLPPIHNAAFVRALLQSTERTGPGGFDPSSLGALKLVRGTLLAVADELIDVPLFYHLPWVCKTLHCQVPSMKLMQSAIVNAGYRVSSSHYEPNAIKTDAPAKVIYDILRVWVQRNPLHKERLADPIVARILAQEVTTNVDFSLAKQVRDKVAKAAKEGKAGSKFFPNPKKFWGPKAAAHGSSARQTHKRSVASLHNSAADATPQAGVGASAGAAPASHPDAPPQPPKKAKLSLEAMFSL